MFNRFLISLYLLFLFIYGYLELENKNNTVFTLIIFSCLILGIVYNFIRDRIFLSRPVFYFLLFFLFVFISLIFNQIQSGAGFDILRNIVAVASILLWPLVFFYFSQQKLTNNSIRKMFHLIHFLGIIIALNCLLPLLVYVINRKIIGELVVSNGKIRSFGYLTDQVGFALVYFLIDAQYKRKLFYVVLYSLAILVTGTRAAVLVGVASCLITWLYGKRKSGSISKLKGIIILSCSLIIYFIFFDSEGNSFLNILNLRLDSNSVASTSAQRFAAIKAGISIFLDNPVFGVGYGNFAPTIMHNQKLLSLFRPFYSANDQVRAFANAQNQLVDIAANGGVACIIAVSFFLYYCIKRISYLIKTSQLTDEYRIILIYLVSIALFDQSALYLFNFGICSFLILILLGIANARQTIPLISHTNSKNFDSEQTGFSKFITKYNVDQDSIN